MRTALSNLFSGMPKRQAGIDAGDTPGSATHMVNSALRLAAGNDLFLKAMDEKGISNEKLAGILAEGLEAKNPFKPDQKDYGVIHKFWHDAGKARDIFPASRIKKEGEERHVHLHLTADDVSAYEKYRTMRGEIVESIKDPY